MFVFDWLLCGLIFNVKLCVSYEVTHENEKVKRNFNDLVELHITFLKIVMVNIIIVYIYSYFVNLYQMGIRAFAFVVLWGW